MNHKAQKSQRRSTLRHGMINLSKGKERIEKATFNVQGSPSGVFSEETLQAWKQYDDILKELKKKNLPITNNLTRETFL